MAKKKQQKQTTPLFQDKRNAAMALAIQGFSADYLQKKTGVNSKRAEMIDARYDRGSFLAGSRGQAKANLPAGLLPIYGTDIVGGRGGLGVYSGGPERAIERGQRRITKDFLRQYGSQDFISQLKIRRKEAAGKPTNDPSVLNFEPRPVELAGTYNQYEPPQDLFYQPTPGVYEPFELEEGFYGGSPQDATRRGGVKRNRGSRASRASAASTKNSLSIGGGATGSGAIGGRQLSL
jgi:hypothetical protein